MLLFAMAVLPGILFLYMVWKKDKIEREPLRLLLLLFVMGAIVAIPVAITETLLDDIFLALWPEDSYVYLLLEYFVGVALIEETGKFFVTKLISYEEPDFNYHFDGIVYAVSASMGFAVLENIFYVFDNGFGTAISRALLSVPCHGIFAIFMGHYISKAKQCVTDEKNGEVRNLWLAILVPTLYHGFYDFCLSTNNGIFILLFFLFIIVLYINTFISLRRYAKNDQSFEPEEIFWGDGMNPYGEIVPETVAMAEDDSLIENE